MNAIVTTEHRGVFYGHVPDDAEPGDGVLKITNARMVVYWDASIRGLPGLAANGPGPKCRISPAAPVISVCKITSIMQATDAAHANFEAEPWG